MSEQCARTAEVEAVFDGRFPADEALELESHVAGCVVCRELRADLQRLRTSLRETATQPNTFVMKRLRRTTLARAMVAARQTAHRPGRLRLALAATTLLLVLGSVLGVVLWLRPSASSTQISVMFSPGASFTRQEDGSREIVRLIDGTFDFDVDSHAGGKRLLVVVPDGEIEDIGTRFRVVVEGGVTTEIAVFSGEVELRKVGSAPLRLIAGMTYHPLDSVPPTHRAMPSITSAEPVTSQSPPRSASVAPVSASAAVVVQAPALTVDKSASSTVEPSVPRTATSASVALPEPTGLTEEDVEYLRIVRLLRDGKRDEARAAAGRYIVKFPDGLRHREVEAIRDSK